MHTFKIRGLLVFVLIFFGLNGNTWGADWREYAKDKDKISTYFYDAKSIKKFSKSRVRVLEKITYTFMKPPRNNGDRSYSITLWEIDCTHQKMRLLNFNRYSQDDRRLSSINQKSDWEYAVPESVEGKLFHTVCR